MIPELSEGDACWIAVRIPDGEAVEEISADSADVFKIDFDVYYLLTSTDYMANVIYSGIARKH